MSDDTSDQQIVKKMEADPLGCDQELDDGLADARASANSSKLFGVSFERWDVAANFLTVLAFLSVLAGGVWAVFEYSQRVEASKARETMALIDVWDTRGAGEDYKSLVVSISVVLNELEVQAENSNLSETEKREKILQKTRTRLLSNNETRSRVENVVQFFSRLALCVKAELCSFQVSKVFFENTISSFLVYFEPFIVEQQISRSSYGQSILDLNSRFTN